MKNPVLLRRQYQKYSQADAAIRVAWSSRIAYQSARSREPAFTMVQRLNMAENLKLLALDAEDLTVISAHLQDAAMRVEDLVFSGRDDRLVLGLNRFAWEAEKARGFLNRRHERRRSILQIDRVIRLRSKGIDRGDKDAVLSVLALTFDTPDEGDPSGTLTITFSGDAVLQAEVECIEVRLSDQGGAWAARSRPRHKA